MTKVLITGVAGCIGSWIAKHLVDDGHEVVGIDLRDELPLARRLGVADAIDLRRLDVTDSSAFEALVHDVRPDAALHLVSMLMPACRANPVACVAVNVTSFMTMLELAREMNFSIAYASSAWVLAPTDDDSPLDESAAVDPQSLYGVFKHTNEGMASTYAREYGVQVNGLRPYIVYGPGREAGLTADVNLALASAARGEPYRIGFGGEVALHHVSDVARTFIRLSTAPTHSGRVYNVRGSVVTMDQVVETIEAVTRTSGLISYDDAALPIAANLADGALQRDYGPLDFMELERGFRETLPFLTS